MFKFLKLYAENLYSFPILELDFEKYSKGTTIILGKNLDMDSSNGAGKSSILKILFFALWGKDVKGEAVDKIIRRNSTKGFLTRIIFSDGNHLYVITRYKNYKGEVLRSDGKQLKGTGIEFTIDGRVFEAEGDKNTVQNMIDSKLGMSSKVFLNSIYTEQKKKKNFLEVSDGEKKDILTEILDLSYYDVAHKLIKKDIEKKEMLISSLDNNIVNYQERVKDKESVLSGIDEKINLFEKDQDESIKKIEKQMEILNEEIVKINIEIEKKNEKILSFDTERYSSLLTRKKQLEIELNNESKIIQGKQKIETSKIFLLKKKDENIKKIDEYKKRNENLYLKIVEIEDISMDDKFFDNELSLIKVEKINLEKKVSDLADKINLMNLKNSKIKELNDKLKKEEEELVKVKKESICTECHRTFKDDEVSFLKNTIDLKENKIVEYNKIIKIINDEMSELPIAKEGFENSKSMLEKLKLKEISKTEERNKLILKLNDIKNKKLQNKHIEQSISENKLTIEKMEIENLHGEEELKQLDLKLLKVNELENKLAKFKEENNQNDIMLKEFDDLIGIKKDLEHLNSLKNIKTELLEKSEREYENVLKKENPFISLKNESLSLISDFTNKILDSKEKIKIEKDELKYLLFWERGFSKTGLRSFIIDDVINVLNIKMNDHLQILSEGVISVLMEPEKVDSSGVIGNKINTVAYLNGEETTLGLSSGGEEQRAILAADLALSDVAELRSGTRFNIKFLDEPFIYIDGAGQKKILALFNKLAKEREGFFIISHDVEMQSFCNNAIYVIKENDESRIVDRDTYLFYNVGENS